MPDIKRPLFFCGENPALTLYAPGTEQIVAIASYWHCIYSPLGSGQALILWAADQPAHCAIFTDNQPLARALVETLVRHFPEFRGVPLDTLPYLSASCQHTFDGHGLYQAQCETPEIKVEIEWRELLDQKQILWPGFIASPARYDLTTVICPCRWASVKVNGQLLPGGVQTGPAADGRLSSSAFLAFAETWVGPVTD